MPDKKSRLYGGRKEEELSPLDRLGLAYCRIEGLEWDEHIGPKPKGFDEAPDNVKRFIVERHMRRIETMVGLTFLDRCRWVFDQGRSEESWIDGQARMWEKGQLAFAYLTKDVPRESKEGVSLTFS